MRVWVCVCARARVYAFARVHVRGCVRYKGGFGDNSSYLLIIRATEFGEVGGLLLGNGVSTVTGRVEKSDFDVHVPLDHRLVLMRH